MQWDPYRGISILADFGPISFHTVVVFGLDKDLLFKSVLSQSEKLFEIKPPLDPGQAVPCLPLVKSTSKILPSEI